MQETLSLAMNFRYDTINTNMMEITEKLDLIKIKNFVMRTECGGTHL
jgi:hypothetical protein